MHYTWDKQFKNCGKKTDLYPVALLHESKERLIPFQKPLYKKERKGFVRLGTSYAPNARREKDSS